MTASPSPNLVLGHVNSYEFTILRLLSSFLHFWFLAWLVPGLREFLHLWCPRFWGCAKRGVVCFPLNNKVIEETNQTYMSVPSFFVSVYIHICEYHHWHLKVENKNNAQTFVLLLSQTHSSGFHIFFPTWEYIALCISDQRPLIKSTAISKHQQATMSGWKWWHYQQTLCSQHRSVRYICIILLLLSHSHKRHTWIFI